MKRLLVISTLVLLSMASYSFAHMHQGATGKDMMESPGYGTSEESENSGHGMMGSGAMGYGGAGMMQHMGPGMMGYGMVPGMMGGGGCGMMGTGAMGYGGCGMMQQMVPGMMGYGMGQGMMGYGRCGMMGYGMGPGMMRGYDSNAYEKFMNDTKDLRKKLHDKKFEYFEAVRQPDITREDVSKIEKEMWKIKKNINDKWQQ